MDLAIEDVAKLLNVTTQTVDRWLAEGVIPAYQINDQYRFSRIEIEDWVMNQQHASPSPFNGYREKESKTFKNYAVGTHQFSLYRALHKGNVITDMIASNREELIENTVHQIAEPLGLDVSVLGELLLDREQLHSTALGNGFAVPHARDLLLSPHQQESVTIVIPTSPVPFGALDGLPVHTFFFLFASEDKHHLHLLAKIAHLCNNPKTVQFFKERPTKEAVLAFIKQWEGEIS